VTWVRQYIGYAGPLPAYGPADFIKRPLDWTLGGFTPVMAFFSNVQLAANLVIPLGLLPCKHFPQMSIPALLADRIRRSASRHRTRPARCRVRPHVTVRGESVRTHDVRHPYVEVGIDKRQSGRSPPNWPCGTSPSFPPRRRPTTNRT
jgi:hypothetical protein